MLLSSLMSYLRKDTFIFIYGCDDTCNKNFNIFNGYAWQLIIGGHIEDCDVMSITNDLSSGALVICLNALYDEYRGTAKQWR